MANRLIKIVKDLLPPMIWRFLQRSVNGSGYFGNYSDWQSAKQASTGYDADLILNRVRESLLKVKSGEAVYERDSVLFDEIQYSWPLLAALLWIASLNGNKLDLIDYGGSLGSSYYQNRKFFCHLEEFHWSVVEQDSFVKCGRDFFENDNLKFHYSLDDCMKDRNPRIIVLSSVLPYLEHPYQLIKEILERQIPYIVIDRTPFIEGESDRLTLQRVPAEIYDASYPAWIFGKDKFVSLFETMYELVAEFEALAGEIRLKNGNAKDLGLIFRRKWLD